MIQKECLICGKNQKIKILYKANFNASVFNKRIFSARRIPDLIHYQINKCLKCGLIFSSPILKENKIISLYKNSNLDYDEILSYINRTYCNYLNKFLPIIPNNFKILDIGCGNGFFLGEAKRLGFRYVYGIEPSKNAVSKARKDIKKNIKIDIFKKGIFPKSSINVITCFQTLDHLINPDICIKTTYEILKKRGMAYFIVHNTDGLSVKLFGEKSAIFDVEHIYFFNKTTLKRIFYKQGFKKIKVFDIKSRYPLGYWIKMIPIPIFLKKFLLDVLHQIKIENIPVTIKAGNIAIVAFKD